LKKLIDWVLGLFKKQEAEVTFEAWPFPSVSEDFDPRPCEKKKPVVKKATTRTVKKPAVAAKTARTKKAK